MAIYQLPKELQGAHAFSPMNVDKDNKFGRSAVLSVIPPTERPKFLDNANSKFTRHVGLGGLGCKYFALDRLQLDASFNSQINIQDITTFVTFQILDNPGSGNYILNLGARVNIAIGKEGIPSGDLGVSYYDGSAFRYIVLDASPSLNTLYTIVFSKSQGEIPRAAIFKNNQHILTTTFGNTNNIVYANTRQFSLASKGTWSSATNNSVLAVYHAGILNVGLDDSKIRDFGANTYQILKPKTPSFYFTAESAGGVTGTASHQADTATHSATGERVVTGSASHSATTATHSASGVVSGQITGTANHQAITATHTATGSRIVAGSSSHQASNATNSAIGERVVSGSCSHSANTATHVAVGERSVTGSATHQANDAAHIAAGTRTITGNSSHQAQTATGSAIVERVISGSSAHQASTATHSASGSVGGVIAGSANHQANASTHSATGERVISGTSSHQANASANTATAERIVTSISSHTANTATHSATGSVGNAVSGTASHAANDATHSAVGLRIVGGTATHQAGNATHSASGTAQGTTTGTASHQATRATHNAIGLRIISGSGSHQAQTATQAASDIPLIQIPLGVRQTSDITPVRGILNTTPSYGILKLG